MFGGLLQVPEGLLDAEEVASSSSTAARVHHCSNLVDRAVSQVGVQHFRRNYKSRATQQKMLRQTASERSAKFAAIHSKF